MRSPSGATPSRAQATRSDSMSPARSRTCMTSSAIVHLATAHFVENGLEKMREGDQVIEAEGACATLDGVNGAEHGMHRLDVAGGVVLRPRFPTSREGPRRGFRASLRIPGKNEMRSSSRPDMSDPQHAVDDRNEPYVIEGLHDPAGRTGLRARDFSSSPLSVVRTSTGRLP
jgi:hypothetical protein